MKFSEYCNEISKTRGLVSLLCQKLNVSAPALFLWRAGKTRIPIWFYRQIEEVTHGHVTVGELVDEQSELHKHKGRRTLSRSAQSQPRDLPRDMGGNRAGGKGVHLPADKERESGVPTAEVGERPGNKKDDSVSGHKLGRSNTGEKLQASTDRILDGLRKAKESFVGSTQTGGV